MDTSILTTIKRMLGIAEDYDHFDEELITYINAVFPTLTQLAVGPEDGFMIADASTTWDDYLKGDKRLNSVKQYIYIKVRLIFDPPTSSIASDAMKNSASELESRILYDADTWRLNK